MALYVQYNVGIQSQWCGKYVCCESEMSNEIIFVFSWLSFYTCLFDARISGGCQWKNIAFLEEGVNASIIDLTFEVSILVFL